MLQELSKEDKKWRRMALAICRNKQLADDLTNDMYLQLHKANYKEINDWFIFVIIKNLYLHHLRKTNKTKLFTELDKVEKAECNEKLNERHLINDALNELDFYDREILLHTSERSLRKNRDFLNITVDVLYYSRKNALEKLKDTDTIKKYKSA